MEAWVLHELGIDAIDEAEASEDTSASDIPIPEQLATQCRLYRQERRDFRFDRETLGFLTPPFTMSAAAFIIGFSCRGRIEDALAGCVGIGLMKISYESQRLLAIWSEQGKSGEILGKIRELIGGAPERALLPIRCVLDEYPEVPADVP